MLDAIMLNMWKAICTRFNLSKKRVMPENMIRNSKVMQIRKMTDMPNRLSG